MIDLDHEGKPIKYQGGKELVPRLAKILDGWRKEYPPTNKKLTMGIYIPECISYLGRDKADTEQVKEEGDLTVIKFNYLLRLGEYTIKGR